MMDFFFIQSIDRPLHTLSILSNKSSMAEIIRAIQIVISERIAELLEADC